MGRWRYNDDQWDYYSDHRPRQVEGGLRTKKGRGSIGETWWSKRWLAVLESFSMGARLTRGRMYARRGQVLSIEITPGVVKAKVQGSLRQPYKIQIQLKPLTDAEWERATEAMSAQAIFAAKLLAGEMPTSIEDAFSAVQLSLFPGREADLVTSCTCPDWANPCKHIAAVYYILAEQFDADPFLIFKLRGRTKEAIIEALRQKRVESLPIIAKTPSPATNSKPAHHKGEPSLRLEHFLDAFWLPGGDLESFTVRPGTPLVDKAILKRLGDAPFSVGEHNLADLLAKAYDTISTSIAEEER